MKGRRRKLGSAMLLVVFVTALLAVTVAGHLQVNAEEIQLMQNHVYGAEAVATAEAGLNDALARLREDATWAGGFTDVPFNDGSYTIVVTGPTITATGITSRGFTATVRADITVSPDGPPHLVQIDNLRINE
jgi:hypothetical protein